MVTLIEILVLIMLVVLLFKVMSCSLRLFFALVIIGIAVSLVRTLLHI